MFCLYHFSVKCIIKKNYLPPYDPLMLNNLSNSFAVILIASLELLRLLCPLSLHLRHLLCARPAVLAVRGIGTMKEDITPQEYHTKDRNFLSVASRMGIHS